MLGVEFGQKNYVLTILKDVEDEVYRNSSLQFKFPWFNDRDFIEERLARQIRLNRNECEQLDAAASVLRGWVLSNAANYKTPPSPTDCRMLAFGQIRPSTVVTDDLSMHQLADEFLIPVWHGYELLKKMHSAKMVASGQVREIFEALEINGDLLRSWKMAKHKEFVKIFGKSSKN